MTASPPPPPSSLKILMAFIQYLSAVLSVARAVSQGPLQAAITRFLNFTLKKDARKVTRFPQLCRYEYQTTEVVLTWFPFSLKTPLKLV